MLSFSFEMPKGELAEDRYGNRDAMACSPKHTGNMDMGSMETSNNMHARSGCHLSTSK